MSAAESEATTKAEVVNEASVWLAGGGILTTALAPLALPILVLTIVAILPLLLIGLVPVLLVGLVALPVVAAVRLVRRVRARPRPFGAPQAGKPGFDGRIRTPTSPRP